MKIIYINIIKALFNRVLIFAIFPLFTTATVFARSDRETAQRADPHSQSTVITGLKFSYSLSPESNLEQETEIGDASINYFNIELNLIKQLSEDVNVFLGLSKKSMNLDISGEVPLPDQLHAVGLSFGAQRQLDKLFGPSWTGVLRVQTEFSADTSSLAESKPSFMGVVFLSHQQTPTFSWDLGIMGRSHGDYPVLPLIGAKWKFAPKWMASLGFPRTGFTYEYSQKMKLHTGVGFKGGLYHVSTEKSPNLKDTWLEYTEVRAGISLECQINKHLTLQLGGGTVINREFNYYDQDYKIEGSSTSYFSFDLQTRF